MFVGMEAAELEYESKTPYDHEALGPWDSEATRGEVMNYLCDEGLCHEAIEDYLNTMDEIDEDRAQIIMEALDSHSPAYWHNWFEGWMKRRESRLREGFNKWYYKWNGGEEC
jgi:hypothetical protein